MSYLVARRLRVATFGAALCVATSAFAQTGTEETPVFASPEAPASAPAPRVDDAPVAEPVERRETALAVAPAEVEGDAHVDEATQAPLRERVSDRLRPLSLGEDYVTLGGYVSPVFDYVGNTEGNANDYDGFALRTSRLIVTTNYDFNENFSAGARVELDFLSGGVSTTDAYAQMEFWQKRIRFSAGQMKTAFSLSQLTSDAGRQFAHGRGLTPSSSRLRGFRDRGIRLDLNLPVGIGHLTWIMSVTNGDGLNVNRNVDSRFLYSTFIDYAPLGELGMDEPDLNNSAFRFGVGGSAWHTPQVSASEFGFAGRGVAETRYAVHGRLKVRGLSLRGEYMASHGEKIPDEDQILRRGWYAQAGYVLPWLDWPQLEVVARFEQVDLNNLLTGFESDPLDLENAKLRRFELGLNAYLVDHRIKAMAVYRRVAVIEGSNRGPSGDRHLGDEFTIGLQFGAF